MKTRYQMTFIGLVALLCFSVVFHVSASTLVHEQKWESSKPLPLGFPHLNETRKTTVLAPGMTHTHILRGESSEKDYFTVDVVFRSTKAEAEKTARRLELDGYEPSVQRIDERAPDDLKKGPLGYLVQVGHFSGAQEAESFKSKLAAKGYSGLRVVYTGDDGSPTTGPWNIHMLKIDPKHFKGSILPELGTGIVPGKKRLTDMSLRTHALAGINGGYFVTGENDGTTGDLSGISAIKGRLISEAIDRRTGLILPASGKKAKVAELNTKLTLISSDGSQRELDGINRKPGLIRGCGGVGGDQPTELPKHDFTCTDESELIQFTPDFGKVTEPGTGWEVVLDKKGRVVHSYNSRGNSIPEKGSVLSATGNAANWLRTHAKPKSRLKVETKIFSDRKYLPLQPQTGIINGGPRLLQRGKTHITAFAEGFHWEEKPEFYYRFGIQRNPRTLAGTTPDGKILLVTVDGRQPGFSVGLSFKESARLMKALGASDAVNLDGGGSTTMTIHQQMVNHPSDATGERPIGDGILIFPRQ